MFFFNKAFRRIFPPLSLIAALSISHPLMAGCWTWFIDPRAVRYNGKTYFGAIDSAGSVKVLSLPDGGLVSDPTVLKSAMEYDDHDNPSILIRDSDKKILVFYSKHYSSVMYLRISSNPEDISSFGSETDLASSLGGAHYTYPNPIQLLNEVNDPIYLFYRDGSISPGQQWAYSKSTDGGSTWAARTLFYGHDTYPYLRFASDGQGRIDIAVSNHPAYDAATKMGHFYYSGGNFYQTDGTLISASLPLDLTDVTEVYNSAPDQCWIWDIARDSGGNLAMVFMNFPSSSDHEYYYARWNGSSWVVNQILDTGTNGLLTSGEVFYAGGIVLDPDDVDTVYLSRPINGVFEIWKYVTSNGGVTWTGTAITENSSQNNARPVVIRGNGVGSRKILWWEGAYPSYTTYDTQIKAGDG